MGNWKDFVKDFCTKEKNIEVLRRKPRRPLETTAFIPVPSMRWGMPL